MNTFRSYLKSICAKTARPQTTPMNPMSTHEEGGTRKRKFVRPRCLLCEKHHLRCSREIPCDQCTKKAVSRQKAGDSITAQLLCCYPTDLMSPGDIKAARLGETVHSLMQAAGQLLGEEQASAGRRALSKLAEAAPGPSPGPAHRFVRGGKAIIIAECNRNARPSVHEQFESVQQLVVDVPCELRKAGLSVAITTAETKGGNGCVYVVRPQCQPARTLAVKVSVHFAIGSHANGETRKRSDEALKRELEMLRYAEGVHGVVQLEGQIPGLPSKSGLVCFTDKCSGILMQYVDNVPLEKATKTPGWQLNCLRVLRSIVEAVAGLHSRSLVHGDLKLSNCLIHSSCQAAVLVDLGCCVFDSFGMAGYGTVGHRAPELAQGPEIRRTCGRITGSGAQALDLWACGVLCLGIASGSRQLIRDRQGEPRYLLYQRQDLHLASLARQAQDVRQAQEAGQETCWPKQVSLDMGCEQRIKGKSVYAWIADAMAFQPGSRVPAASILKNWKLREPQAPSASGSCAEQA
jgi:hypothetical protein